MAAPARSAWPSTGHLVLIADRAGAEQAAAEVVGAHGYTTDLAEPEETLALAERVLEQHGRCDVLVNNAAELGMHDARAARARELQAF